LGSSTPTPWQDDLAPRLIEAALDAIVSIDASGRVVQFNPAAEAMFGYAGDEAIGQPLADLIIPPDLQAAHWARLLRIATGEEAASLDRRIETRARRRNGQELSVELAMTRTGDSPLLLTYFLRDLSPLKAAERRQDDMQRVLATGEALAQLGSWELDLRTGATVWSDEMYRILGFEPQAVAPSIEQLLDRVHPADRARRRAALLSIREDPDAVPPRGFTAEYRIVRTDGAERTVRTFGMMVRDEQDRPACWVGWGQDVTDWLVIERDLHARDAVSEALREWESGGQGVVGLLRRFGTALDFSVGSLWTPTHDRSRLICRAFWSAEDVDAADFELATRSRSFRPGEGFPGRVWESGQPVISDDVSADPNFTRRAAASSLGLRAGLAFPAMGEASPVAVLSFYGFEERGASKRLVRTLTGIGRELGEFLLRRRAELEPRRLSDRELDVLRLAAEGNTGPEIAQKLRISPATVKSHFRSIYEKFGVGDRAGAVAHGMRIGLIR
jgi:two-component system cell cycle sensor histidine kinase/response regulator CckA